MSRKAGSMAKMTIPYSFLYKVPSYRQGQGDEEEGDLFIQNVKTLSISNVEIYYICTSVFIFF